MTKRLKRQLILAGLAVTAAVSMSGCWWDANFVGCVHYDDAAACDRLATFGAGGPVSPEYSSAASVLGTSSVELKAKGKRYSATFFGRPLKISKPKRATGGKLVVKRIVLSGSVIPNGAPPPELAAHRNAVWHGLMSATLDRRKHRMTLKGKALVTLLGTNEQTCLRFSGRTKNAGNRKATLRGSFRTIGATAGAKDLNSLGSFRRTDAGTPGFTMSGRAGEANGRLRSIDKSCGRVLRAVRNP